jgi:argininosuccinate lyase
MAAKSTKKTTKTSAGKKTELHKAVPVLWDSRLSEKPEVEAFAFQSSIKFDYHFIFDDIRGSIAHVTMLGKQGIIPRDSASKIAKELDSIANEIKSGKFQIDTNAEDIHSFLEAVLVKRLGETGKMVHAGRSRNDQVALDFRLYLKRKIAHLQADIAMAANTLLDIASSNITSIMPGYTHLQRAQPVTLAFHLAAWCAALERDRSRFTCALTRIDECPLGSGALAGSTLPLDRKATAQALHFKQPTVNAMDSVADRDFVLEVSSACAITMVHLSRFCEDIVLWASEEFKFIELSDSWSTGSSIMPQKKNPDFAELIRGKSGRAVGNLVTLFTMLKGLPYAYNKDLQEDKEALFDSITTLENCLRIFAGMMKSAQFNLKEMKGACKGGFMEATDVAEYLVRKGLPFREAHEITAQIVKDCTGAGQKYISDRTIEELKKRSKLFDADIYKAITPIACVKSRSLPGGPAPKEVRRQIKALRKKLSK